MERRKEGRRQEKKINFTLYILHVILSLISYLVMVVGLRRSNGEGSEENSEENSMGDKTKDSGMYPKWTKT